MRTVNPDLWSREVKKPPLNVSRPFKFGLNGLSPFETRLRKSFRDAIVDFCKNCSVKGCTYVMDRKNINILRWCYLLAVLITAGGGVALLSYDMAYLRAPSRLSAWAQRDTYAARREDFPAVAICSFNLISRFALDEYAQYVYSLDKNNTYSLEALKNNLLAYGAIHSRRPAPFDFNFETYLAKVAHETNVTNILYKLTPDCNRMLERCIWDTRRVSCGRLFAKRITSTGFCCVFNSRYHLMDRHNPVYATRLVGEDSGLGVVVREHPDDVTQLRRPLHGFDVYIFDGWQYPAARAGVVSALPAPLGALVSAQLRPRSERVGRSLWTRSDGWLGCRLNRNSESLHTPFVVVERSWSWCVGICRRRAALALCRCAPHTLPPLGEAGEAGEATVCALQHLACLAKYSDKLTWLYPGEVVHASLSEERENAVECEECLADCSRTRYRADISVTTLSTNAHMFFNYFLKGLDLANATVIRMFYTSEDREYYVLETNVQWYGVIALLGSQWLLLVGVTVVSVLELLYHCVFRWCFHYLRRLRLDTLVKSTG